MRVMCASTTIAVVPGRSAARTSTVRPPSDYSGRSVALDSAGDTVAIGAYLK